MVVCMVNFDVTVDGLHIKSERELQALQVKIERVLREALTLDSHGSIDVEPTEYAGEFELYEV